MDATRCPAFVSGMTIPRSCRMLLCTLKNSLGWTQIRSGRAWNNMHWLGHSHFLNCIGMKDLRMTDGAFSCDASVCVPIFFTHSRKHERCGAHHSSDQKRAHMRKLIVSNLVTLDGYYEGK